MAKVMVDIPEEGNSERSSEKISASMCTSEEEERKEYVAFYSCRNCPPLALKLKKVEEVNTENLEETAWQGLIFRNGKLAKKVGLKKADNIAPEEVEKAEDVIGNTVISNGTKWKVESAKKLTGEVAKKTSWFFDKIQKGYGGEQEGLSGLQGPLDAFFSSKLESYKKKLEE